MSGRWFRFYDEVLDDPKVQTLAPDEFKAWVNMLCVASRNGGFLPSIEKLAFAMRCDLTVAERWVSRWLDATLLDKVSGGEGGYRYAPHGWSKRQYKSDTSTERVKRFRSVSKTVTVTAPETDTETDITLSKDSGASASSDSQFWESAKSYLAPHNRKPGALIGKWCRDHGKQATASAIGLAQIERAVDPIPYVERILRGPKKQAMQMSLA